MDASEVMNQVQDGFEEMGEKLNAFFSFVTNKLVHFSDLSVGEQIAYGCILLGIVLMITAVILFFVM